MHTKLIFNLEHSEDDRHGGRPFSCEILSDHLKKNDISYESVHREGESIVVTFGTSKEATTAYSNCDGTSFLGSTLCIKQVARQETRSRRSDGERRGNYNRNDRYNNRGGGGTDDSDYDDYDRQGSRRGDGRHGGGSGSNRRDNSHSPNRVEQYPCRILIPTDMIKVVLGKNGSTISGIQSRTNTKIDIHRDKGPTSSRSRQLEDTLTTIKGDNVDFSAAVKEMMRVIDDEYQKSPYEDRRPLQLKLLAHDSLCGRIIGKAGNNLKQTHKDTGAKLVISNSIFEDVSAYALHGAGSGGGMLSSGERVVTMEGELDAVLAAEEAVSTKLRHFLERDMKNSSHNMPGGQQMSVPAYMGGPGMGGQQMYGQQQRAGYNQGYSQQMQGGMYGGYYGGYGGYPGSFPGQMNNHPGILGGPYPPITQLMAQPHCHHSDTVEKSYVTISTKEVGAMIGKKGEHISRMKQYSGAAIRVIKGEEGGDSKVEIIGVADCQWKAQLFVFHKIKEGMKVPYSEAQLKTEYYVPSDCVGRIIGKKGQVVQEIQEKSVTDIEVPKEKQGGDEVPVYITGTFNGTQICLNRIRDIVSRAQDKE